MYGDTDAIRRLADALRGQAAELRAEATDLLGRAEGVRWQGWAADAMRSHARDRVAALRRTAQHHDDAADALDRHAGEVERLQALIEAIQRRAQQLMAAARERLADLGHQVADGLRRLLPDPVDELLAGFVPPPSGHRDWLAVDLPGLRR